MAKGPSRLDNVISLAKRRGFVFPCGDIYGGTRSAWDYGPLGVELKENIKRAWWNYMVRRRADVVGLDSSVILPRGDQESRGARPTQRGRGSFAGRACTCGGIHERAGARKRPKQ